MVQKKKCDDRLWERSALDKKKNTLHKLGKRQLRQRTIFNFAFAVRSTFVQQDAKPIAALNKLKKKHKPGNQYGI